MPLCHFWMALSLWPSFRHIYTHVAARVVVIYPRSILVGSFNRPGKKSGRHLDTLIPESVVQQNDCNHDIPRLISPSIYHLYPHDLLRFSHGFSSPPSRPRAAARRPISPTPRTKGGVVWCLPARFTRNMVMSWAWLWHMKSTCWSIGHTGLEEVQFSLTR